MARSKSDPNRVAVVGLTARFRRPFQASPRVRDEVPKGYGTQEQCLPFVAAAGLGFTVPSPFAWGFCAPQDAPESARRFRSPISGGCPHRAFYVLDDPAHDFDRNQFRLPPETLQRTGPLQVPGLSFFDREDQQDLVKLHLPYVWHTDADLDLLFLAPINRVRADGMYPLAGLVESAWYLNSVNLVMQLPPYPATVRVAAGEPIAQVVVQARTLRSARLEVPEIHRRETRAVHEGVAAFQAKHASDRSAYKRLVKTKVAGEGNAE